MPPEIAAITIGGRRVADDVPPFVIADFPHMLVQAARGRPVTPALGRFRDALSMTSYETSVFVAETSIGFSSTVAERIEPEVA